MFCKSVDPAQASSFDRKFAERCRTFSWFYGCPESKTSLYHPLALSPAKSLAKIAPDGWSSAACERGVNRPVASSIENNVTLAESSLLAASQWPVGSIAKWRGVLPPLSTV